MRTEGELRLETLLQRCEPPFRDARRLVARECVVAKVGERLAAEKRQRGAQELGLASRINLPARLVGELLEASEIELLGSEPQNVAGWPGLDRVRPEQLAERRNMSAQGGLSGLRRRLAPERIEKLVRRDDLVRMQQ